MRSAPRLPHLAVSKVKRRRKIDETKDRSCAVGTQVVPDDVPIGWLHTEELAVRTKRDTSRDYIPVSRTNEDERIGYNSFYPNDPNEPEVESVSVLHWPIITEGGPPPSRDVFGGPVPAQNCTPTSSFVSATSNEVKDIPRLLEDACVLQSTDGAMSMVEMCSYVRGGVAR